VAVKLYRCGGTWVKLSGHPCWRVQKALDGAGIEYEIVKGPARHSRRDELQQLSGQRSYPVIVLEDGTAYREESNDMAARIAAGKLFDQPASAPTPSDAS
jgi:glutathione S-transferase